jgi:hypothetical protein
MILDNIFASQKTYQASIQILTQTFVNGQIGAKVWTTSKTVECLFWRGSLAVSMVSEKFKADVAAVVIVRPDDITMQEIPVTSRICIKDAVIAGKINHIGGYSAGALTIAVDDFIDNKNPIKKGDTFTIAGEAGSSVHTVDSVTTTAGVTTGITFTTAIVTGGVADDAGIVLTPVLGYYAVIYPDNIGNQDKVIMIPCKEWA